MVLPMSDPAEAFRHFRQWVIPRLQDVARTAGQVRLEADPQASTARAGPSSQTSSGSISGICMARATEFIRVS